MSSYKKARSKNDRALAEIRKFVPNYELRFKKDSTIQKFFGFIHTLLGNFAYNESVWTTMGNITYRPSIAESIPKYEEEWKVLFHEGWHSIQSARLGSLRFYMMYMFPQLLGILGVISIPLGFLFSPLWLGCIFLLALAPIPSYYRAKLENEAYKISMFLDILDWNSQKLSRFYFDEYIANAFAGPAYYWMWPFRKKVIADFREFEKKIENGEWRNLKNKEYVRYLENIELFVISEKNP